MATIKKQRTYARIGDAGVLEVDFYGEHDEKGKGKVILKAPYDMNRLPPAQLLLCAQKGFSTYGAVRSTSDANGSDPTPQEVKASFDSLYDDMLANTFEPGRAIEAEASALHEALAEHLKMPLADIQRQIKENAGGMFGKEGMGRIARIPAVDVIKQRILRERAAAKEREAKAKAKGAKDSDLTDLQAMFGLAAAPAQAAPAA